MKTKTIIADLPILYQTSLGIDPKCEKWHLEKEFAEGFEWEDLTKEEAFNYGQEILENVLYVLKEKLKNYVTITKSEPDIYNPSYMFPTTYEVNVEKINQYIKDNDLDYDVNESHDLTSVLEHILENEESFDWEDIDGLIYDVDPENYRKTSKSPEYIEESKTMSFRSFLKIRMDE